MFEFITILILVIIIFIVVFWLKKTMFIVGFFFRIFTIAFLVLIALSVIFGYYIIKDAKDFGTHFPNSTSMFILKDDVNGSQKFLTAVTINPSKEEFASVNRSSLDKYEQLYRSDILYTLEDDYYKVFVVDFKSFEDMNIAVQDKNINLTKDEIRRVMVSDDAKDELASIIANESAQDKDAVIKEISVSSEEIKNYIFSYYLTSLLEGKNAVKFIAELKDGHISVYKDTAIFKAIRVVPNFLMDTALEKIQNGMDSSYQTDNKSMEAQQDRKMGFES